MFNRAPFNRIPFNRQLTSTVYVSLSGSVAAQSSVSSDLHVDISFTCTVTSTCSITALLGRLFSISSTVTCESTASATISGILVPISTVVTTESSVNAAVGRERIIVGLIGGAASLTAILDKSPSFITTLAASAAVDGQPYTLYIYATYTPPEQFIEITWEGT